MVSAGTKKRKQVDNKTKAVETTPHDWLHQVAFWGLALLLFFPPYFRGLFFAPEQEKALIFAALVFWVTFLWRWLQGDHKLLATPLDWFALALPAAYILSTFVAVNKGLAIQEVVKNILYFLTFWSISRLVRNERDAESILKIIYVSAIGVAVAGLATATGLIYIKDGFKEGRIFSTFQYPNALASYLGAVILKGAYLWNRARDRYREAQVAARNNMRAALDRINFRECLYACGNFLLLVVLFGSKSRGGLVVFGLVFLIYLVGAGAKKRFIIALHLGYLGVLACITVNKFIPLAMEDKSVPAWSWILAGVVLTLAGQAVCHLLNSREPGRWTGGGRRWIPAFGSLVIVIILITSLGFINHARIAEDITSFKYLENAYQRFYYMKYAFEMIQDKPLLGWGGGGWEEVYRSYMDYRYTTREVHSYYFQVAVETGILGLMVVAGIWFSFLYLAHRLYHGSRETAVQRQLIWTLTTAFFMIAGHALIDFDLSLSALTLVLWSIFGITVGIVPGEPAGHKQRKQKCISLRYFSLGAVTITIILILVSGFCLTQSRAFMTRGITLLKLSDAAGGLEYMKKAVTYNPFRADYHITLSQVLAGMGRDNEAMAEALLAVDLSRYGIVAGENVARIAMATGDHKKASEAAAALIKLAPNEVEAYEIMARIFTELGLKELKEGNADNAREYFVEVVKVSEKLDPYWENLSETYKKLWRGPKLEVSSQLKLYVGKASYWLGEFPAAEKNLKELAGNDKIQAEALMYRALIKEKQGREQQAAGLLEQAEKLSPGKEQLYKEVKDLPVLNKNTLSSQLF